MYQTVRGLVLRVTPYKETDAILSLLTENEGNLTVKVRGLRRKNSPLTAVCQLLSYGEYTLFSYKGMYTVNEAHSLHQFRGLRKEIEKLSLGTYFAQVADVVSQSDMPNSTLLSLTLNCLYALSETPIPHSQIKAVFELRCACLAGYAPDLSGCHDCGNETPQFLDISQGILECGACRNPASDGIRMPINEAILQAMRYICFCDEKKLFAFRAGEETLQVLSQITESYFSTQLERGFSALDFYKSLTVQ